jgi:hypothetical protein
VVAFSGLASAAYVTDKQTKKVYYKGKYTNTLSSYVIHYSNTHIVFVFESKWVTPSGSFKMSRDYKKISKNKILETNYSIYYPKYKTVNTKLSVYSLYKYERAKYGYGIGGIFWCP